MARLSLSSISITARPRAKVHGRLVSSLAYDYLIAVLSAFYVGGVYLDGWAHQHIPTLETFFTPWHAALYGGFGLVAAALVLTAVRNWLRGYSLTHAMPIGYDLSLLGVIIFMLGGVGDLIWHTLFGIEANVEALLSPTHLILVTGMILIVTGPLRAAWHRAGGEKNWKTLLPVLLSLTYTLSMFAFFTQYAHPFGQTYAAVNHEPFNGSESGIFYNQALGIMGILGQTAILMGLVLLAVRRWALPFGSLGLMLGVNTLLLTLMRAGAYTDQNLSTGIVPMVAVALLAGLAGDALLARLKPSADRPLEFHLFAFLMPAILYALYFAAIEFFGGGVWWSIHLWAGAVFLAGIVGFLLSYAMLPPRVQASTKA